MVARGRAGGARKSHPTPAPERPRLKGVAGDVATPAGSLGLDRLIHERVRLGIVSALAADPQLTFTELRDLLQLTDGNLSVHARKLEEAGYVSCEKSFDGRVPRTEYRLTPEGRKALDRYLAHMEGLIRMMRKED